MSDLMKMLSQAAKDEPMTGRADTVPAMLSGGEYVIPADVVAMLGDGNNEAGGKILDKLVAQLRQNYKGHSANPKDYQAFKGNK